MKYYFLFLFSTVLLACSESATGNNADTTMHDTGTEEDKVPVQQVEGCYMNVTGRDTLVAILKQDGPSISGRLTFDNYQKDGSSGSLAGVLQGDVMKLHYSFSSEGMNSVMELFFTVNDKGLVRGIGEMKVRGDSAYFADTSFIRYEGQALNEIECSRVPGKYK